MFSGFFHVWVNTRSLLNILAMNDVTNRFRVTMDSSIDHTIMVHLDNGEMLRFEKIGSGLYMLSNMNRRNSSKMNVTNYSLNLVNSNNAKFTRREVDIADKVRDLYRRVGILGYWRYI